MANLERDQEYLGIDSNALLAYLIPEHPQHDLVKSLAKREHAVNATVLHETYHTAVFKLRRRPEATVNALLGYMRFVLCLPLTAKTVELGLRLALKHGLGGRDALILASYLSAKQIGELVTLDNGLLNLWQVKLGKKTLKIRAPKELTSKR